MKKVKKSRKKSKSQEESLTKKFKKVMKNLKKSKKRVKNQEKSQKVIVGIKKVSYTYFTPRSTQKNSMSKYFRYLDHVYICLATFREILLLSSENLYLDFVLFHTFS